MKLIFSLIFISFFHHAIFAQNKYWVEFKDKANVIFDPYTYFSERTIAQRTAMKIPLADSSDYPVNPYYLERVSILSDSLSWNSRWLNGVAAFIKNQNIGQVVSLAFVKSITPMNAVCNLAATKV